jgi:hypothetical protein
MGTWGLGFDQDDAAADWLADFAGQMIWQAVESTLDSLLGEPSGYDSFGAEARAALEVIAAARGESSATLSATIAHWAKSNSGGGLALVPKAQSAAIFLRDKSYLADSWSEVPEHGEWISAINELRDRLGD